MQYGIICVQFHYEAPMGLRHEWRHFYVFEESYS